MVVASLEENDNGGRGAVVWMGALQARWHPGRYLHEGRVVPWCVRGKNKLPNAFMATGESRSKDPTCEIMNSRKADLSFSQREKSASCFGLTSHWTQKSQT